MGFGLVAQAIAQPPAPAAAPIRIGVIGPFTGPSADFGLPMFNGVKMAVDEINAVGGYLGRSLELVIKDDQANPDIGHSQSLALVNEKVVATIGFCNTGVAMNSLTVFNDAKLPLIVPCATGSLLTSTYQSATTSYIFRTSPKDSIQAPFVSTTCWRGAGNGSPCCTTPPAMARGV